MSTATIALAAFALTLFIHAAALLVWGASLAQRVRQLEIDGRHLKDIPEKLARVEERTSFVVNRVRDLNV